jgi:ATP-dependent helicase/nuclease subunit B
MPLSTSPERLLGLRRRLQADLERYLEHAAQTAGDSERRGALEPTHFELEFGLGQASPNGEGPVLPALDLGDGVRLRGRIDRIDIAPAGEAVVYDYKGKNASPAAKWLSEGSVQVALYMIACEQLLGLRAVGGFYQPLTGSDLRPRGVLDRDGGVQLECVRGDARSREEVRALLEQAAATALEAAGQARRGELEPRPRTCTLRGGCAHPTVCRCRR